MPRKLTLRATFAAALRRQRTDAGMTQAALAEAARLTENYVRALEAGRRAPSLDGIEQLAEALGCEAWRLLKVET